MSLCGSKTDTSGMNAAALANSQVAKDALDWYREAYTDQAPLRQQAADKALAVSDAQRSNPWRTCRTEPSCWSRRQCDRLPKN